MPETDDAELNLTGADSEESESFSITIKRSTFFALLVPLAFLIGLAAGYLIWGRSAAVPPETAQQSSQTAEDVQRYEIPIYDTDPVFGPQNAAVTIIEFSDFECPFCRRHNTEVLPLLLDQYGEQLRYVFKDYPLVSIHPNAFPAAEAAHCAREQGQFWAYHDRLFATQRELGPATYEHYAADLELDLPAFSQCLEERRYADEVQTDFDFAIQLGIRSTPTFFINGIPVVGAQPFSVFQQVIEGELNGTN